MAETSAKANKKRNRDEGDDKRKDHNEDPEEQEQEPAPMLKPKKEFHNKEIPGSSHYQVSWMHHKTVIAVVTSTKHGYVVTASHDGTVKFWKRLSVDTNTAGGDGNNGGGDQQQQQQLHQQPCLEFVKSFTAHGPGTVSALAMDPTGDMCVSVGSDGLLKFYDVSTFDATAMMQTGKALGTAVSWLTVKSRASKAVAVAAADSGNIYIYAADDNSGGSTGLQQTLTLHASTSRVTALAFRRITRALLKYGIAMRVRVGTESSVAKLVIIKRRRTWIRQQLPPLRK
jgi:peptidylprolyl isomerase domain and WD repeat-containing protein 1